MKENTTAIKFKSGDTVYPVGYTKNSKKGTIISVVPPFGTAGEWSYNIFWNNGEGSGWRDCDIQAA
jgi:hypothetical protein